MTQSSLEQLETRRAVMVTGKGGVGKTTVAAALASALARSGRRILVAEVASSGDEPSPLAAALGGQRSREEPVAIAPGIHGVLLTPSMGHRRFLQDALPVRMLADAAMRSSALRRFLAAAPAFGEMGVLYRILDLLRKKRPDGSFEHETCVVDAPATGHALALTELPEILLRLIPGGPIGRAVREGLSLLTDPAHTTTVLVTLPETLPVSEALELAAGLSANGVPLHGAVVNRMPIDPFTPAEREHVDRINAASGPLFGARAVRRMDRARLAVERFQRSLDRSVLTLPELPEHGVELTRRLADVVVAEWRGPAMSPEAG